MEVNNHETFDRIIEIFNSNSDSFDLNFLLLVQVLQKFTK